MGLISYEIYFLKNNKYLEKLLHKKLNLSYGFEDVIFNEKILDLYFLNLDLLYLNNFIEKYYVIL
jgi:hypothetical protein